MILDVTEKVGEFIDSIDASFPFENEESAKKLMSEGAAISDNAALMVAYELATESPKRFLNLGLSLFEQLCRERPTKAIKLAAPIIESLIKGRPCPNASVQALLEYCREQRGCYNALGILSLVSPEMKEAADEIWKGW